MRPAPTEAKVIRLLLVRRKARLNERIQKGEYGSSMYLDRLAGARDEMDLAIKQVDAFIAGDEAGWAIGEEQKSGH